MAKSTKKSTEEKPKKYSEKLVVNGSFLDVVKAAAKNANDKSVKKDAKK
jgi:hypothetical protein